MLDFVDVLFFEKLLIILKYFNKFSLQKRQKYNVKLFLHCSKPVMLFQHLCHDLLHVINLYIGLELGLELKLEL